MSSKLLFADQAQALELDSKVGANESGIDYSLLLDGLTAEREQGITIDVAYRYFSTERRSFIVADCPGQRAVYTQYGGGRIVCRPCSHTGGRFQRDTHPD